MAGPPSSPGGELPIGVLMKSDVAFLTDSSFIRKGRGFRKDGISTGVHSLCKYLSGASAASGGSLSRVLCPLLTEAVAAPCTPAPCSSSWRGVARRCERVEGGITAPTPPAAAAVSREGSREGAMRRATKAAFSSLFDVLSEASASQERTQQEGRPQQRPLLELAGACGCCREMEGSAATAAATSAVEEAAQTEASASLAHSMDSLSLRAAPSVLAAPPSRPSEGTSSGCCDSGSLNESDGGEFKEALLHRSASGAAEVQAVRPRSTRSRSDCPEPVAALQQRLSSSATPERLQAAAAATATAAATSAREGEEEHQQRSYGLGGFLRRPDRRLKTEPPRPQGGASLLQRFIRSFSRSSNEIRAPQPAAAGAVPSALLQQGQPPHEKQRRPHAAETSIHSGSSARSGTGGMRGQHRRAAGSSRGAPQSQGQGVSAASLGVTVAAMRVSDMGGIHIETGSGASVYTKGSLVGTPPIAGPSGLTDASGGGSYYYYGEVRRSKRHGWGLLANEERLLFEGQWQNDTVLGWYICYHELATEFGFRELNEVCGVSVLSDSDFFIVPVRRGKQKHFTIHAASAFTIMVTDMEALQDEDGGAGLLRGAPSTSDSSRCSVASCPDAGMMQQGVAQRQQMDQEEDEGSMSHGRVSFSDLPSDAASSLMQREGSGSVERGKGPLEDHEARGDAAEGPSASEARSSLRSTRRTQTRGATFPEFTTQENLAAEETPLCEGVRRGSSKRGTLTPGVAGSPWGGAQPYLRASDCHKWSCITLSYFLRLLGMQHEAVLFKRNRVSGSDIPSLGDAELRAVGLKDRHTRCFLLSVFRYLWSCTDHRDPLMPHNRRHLKQMSERVPIIASSAVSVGPCVGGGGFAAVHKARVRGAPHMGSATVACKIFRYNPRPTAVAAALTAKPLLSRNPQGAHHGGGPRQQAAPLSGSRSSEASSISSVSQDFAGGLHGPYAAGISLWAQNQSPLIPYSQQTEPPSDIRTKQGGPPHFVSDGGPWSGGSLSAEGTGRRPSTPRAGGGGLSSPSAEGPLKGGRRHEKESPSLLMAPSPPLRGPSSICSTSQSSASDMACSGESRLFLESGDGRSEGRGETAHHTVFGGPKAVASEGGPPPSGSSQFAWEWHIARLRNVDFFRYCPRPVKHRDLEADILSVLQPHSNVVSVYGKCSLRPGEEALLIEYCSRGSLDALIFPGASLGGGPGAAPLRRGKRRAPLTRPEIVRLFEEAAAGLAHVHSCNILHRDIKLSNILVTETTAKESPSYCVVGVAAQIADFGVATAFVPTDSPSVLGLFGNVFYAAPEAGQDDELHGCGSWGSDVACALVGEKARGKDCCTCGSSGLRLLLAIPPCSSHQSVYRRVWLAAVLRGEGFFPASDVWSFGVAFWEALTGQMAFDGLSAGYVYVHVAAGDLRLAPPSDLLPGLRLLLQQMLHPSHKERPTFTDIRRELAALQEKTISAIEEDLDEFFSY
ncbi:tyrosine kinase-like [Cyclospora cayetanensis]|uniref:Tyrosine kinase-like n=1 Tax=Cyclospora cayetanensis TaxID=88456 RepID=A0A1D3D1X6_9EIME|nr:tyrosine kinase-like [Cyclospora cayetanensis]